MAKYCAKKIQFFLILAKNPFPPRFCLLLTLALYLPMGAVRVLMRKVCFSWLVLMAVCLEGYSQLGHEWINYSQSYYKIPVGKDGIYRLTASALQSAGFPTNTVDPTRIQLFHRGTEQAIYVEGEGDLAFNETDFIEFYGRKNDGTLDAQLYKTPSLQPHSYYNLYSDTTSYFLTIGSVPGKRMIFFSENNAGLSAETFHNDEKLLVLTNRYAPGIDFTDVQETSFGLGEGWTGNQIVLNQVATHKISNVVLGVPSAGLPVLEVLLVGRGPATHQVEIYGGASLVAAGIVEGFEAKGFSGTINWTDIDVNGELQVQIKVVGGGSTNNAPRISTSYVRLNYPQQFDVAGATEKTFTLAPNPGGKSYLELQNPSSGQRLFDVTDPSNLLRIGTTATTTLNAIIPSTETPRKIYGSNAIIEPVIRPVNFRQMNPGEHNYIIISHPLLRLPAMGYTDPVKAYAEYRASEAGGSYDTLVVNIQQLYDQFNYGESSPLAVFHFMKFLDINRPEYLLLVGKGLDVHYKYHRNPNANAFATRKDLVPSAGFPGSDMFYTAGLAGTTHEPAVPTGRISAINSSGVAAYLNKVKEMEALPYSSLWRKNILHLSGGILEGEPERFRDYMIEFQEKAEDYYLGGQVTAIAKYSKELGEINIAEQVNRGLNLVTYFGHSATDQLDFDIGDVTNPVLGYNNKGKYPVFLMNGCNLGSIFLTSKMLGENWVLAEDKGAAGFIAHSAYGFTGNLRDYTNMFYSVGYQDSTFMRKGIGDIQKEVGRRYMESYSNTVLRITQIQQMILIGDPALQLFGAPETDLEITDNDLTIESFDGQPITALLDSFAVRMIVRNFGKAKRDTIRIEVVRTLSDNSTIVYDSLYPSAKYSDTLTLIIRKGRESGFGNNTFKVTLDPDNILTELSKENNVATKSFFVPLNGTRNLYPVNFGIVNRPTVNLSFQTTDIQSDEREFFVELDTLNTFNSPFKKTFTVKGKVLGRQDVTLLSTDTLAYYWRTKLADPQAGEDITWTQSSFTYIMDGSEGWAQVHFPQYLENQTEGLAADVNSRRLHFVESITPIAVKTFGSSHPAHLTGVSVKIGNVEYNLRGNLYDCRDNSFNLIAFDRKSTVPYTAAQFEWYNRAGRNCGRLPWVINNYRYDQMVTGAYGDLIYYVDNVPVGDSVLMYSIGNARYSLWPAAAKAKLGELGVSAAQLNALQDGEPVIIYGRKGIAPGTAKFYTTTELPKNMAVLDTSLTVTGRYSSGSMNSGLIGPATKWNSLITRPTEIEAVDQVSFDLIGVNLNMEEQLIMDNVNGDKDLSAVNAEEFPYLKIVFNSEDDTDLSSAQLNKWLLLYTPVPEGLLLYYGNPEQVVINEGEIWQGDYGFLNVTDKTFPDSLAVTYEVFNQMLRTSQMEQIKILPPLPGDTTDFSIRVNTTNRGGLNDVEVYVNARISPEQYYDNNILQQLGYLNVLIDSYNPVLDVTVDGRHLLNGDFVSSNPLIKTQIWDENIYVLKTDTAGVRVFLTYPCSEATCQATRILLTQSDVIWHPATDTSPFTVEFTPGNLADGEYKLRIEAVDARGNSSGVASYEITFQVNSEPTLVISDPYPNPFTDAAYVKLVISGSNLPERLEWRIINSNGQLQSQFETEDFKDLHIGTNELAWKGTDLNGNLLPGGMYIYTLKLTLEGKQTTRMGKLVLIR